MRHRKSRLRLRHKVPYSRALLRNLLTSVLLYEAVRTTKKRAEVVRPQVEKLITVAKTKVPHIAIREINRHVMDRNASRKLMEVLKTRYASRSSGYTRMIPLGARKGDGAKLVTLELVDKADTAVMEAPSMEKGTKKAKAAKMSKAKSASAPASTASASA
jgi:large subunit ribosomal protein L17